MKKALLISFLFVVNFLVAQETTVPDDNFENYLETHDANGDVVALGDVNSMGNGIANDNKVTTSKISSVTVLDISISEAERRANTNPISDLTGLEDFTSLITLNCSSNSLTSINLDSNLNLESITCTSNSLTSLKVDLNTKLTTISCGSNNISGTIDVSKNTSLVSLTCSQNSLTSIDLSANTALTELFCNTNNLTTLDLSANTALTKISLGVNNDLTELNVKNLTYGNITLFSASSNSSLSCIEADTTNSADFGHYQTDPGVSLSTDCHYDETNIPDDNFENYLETHNAAGAIVALGDVTSMGNGIANDDYVLTSRINTVTNLDVNSQTIASLVGIENFTALTTLNCSTNSLTSLYLNNQTSLASLTCNNNSLEELEIKNGNNVNLTLNAATNNLRCVLVDNVTNALTYGWTVDDTDGFTINKCTVTWTGGASSSSWTDVGNWDTGEVPTNIHNIIIPQTGWKPSVSSFITIHDLTITSSSVSVLKILTNKGLTVNGNITSNDESIEIFNQGSLIVKGTASGTIRLFRSLTASNWYLVSSSVSGETIEDLISGLSFTTGTGTNIGFAEYDNNGTGWNYFSNTTTGSMELGKGYSVNITGSQITTVGAIDTSDTGVPITITEGTANSWNLIGNPYPSYIAANSNAASANLLTENAASLDPSFVALYFWDQGANSYVVFNQASTAKYIPPNQGFFVNSKSGGATVLITEDMQSHQTSDTFLRSQTTPEIRLTISDGNTIKSTDIKYIENTTTGLDPGYDAGVFNGTSNSFDVYSHLVDMSSEIDFALQCLPTDNYQNMIIPIGVNAAANQEITFTAEGLGLPAEIKIFLEDRENNTFTRLDETDSNYKITPTIDLQGIGRFYIHTSGETLSVNDLILENIKVYKMNSSTIRIVGLQNGKTKAQLFNILGKQIMNHSFQSNGVEDILLPKLTAGIYIIQIQTEKGKLNKKIILEE